MLFTYPVAGAPDKVIALLVGMVLFVVNEANRVENQVIMQMVFILPVNRPRRIGAFCNLVDVPAHRLQFPDICFCVASVNDKNIPV